MAQAFASVFSSPSPLKALRERGIKGVRVSLSHNHSRRHSIKTATSSINVQSNTRNILWYAHPLATK